mmetsp:Transcript_322/g.1332  ORF Transcript_322/g.1332 Transcript_322/m.1332 type:complete len:259 (+) Transcript_322:327-1103(+)
MTCAPGAPRTWNHTSWSWPSCKETASFPVLFLPTNTSLPLGATYRRTLLIAASRAKRFLLFLFFAEVAAADELFFPFPPFFPPLACSSRICAAAPLPAGLINLASTSSCAISSSASASSAPPPESSDSENSICSRYASSATAAERSGSTALAVRLRFRACLYSFSAVALAPTSGSIATERASPVSKSNTSITFEPSTYPCKYAMISSAAVLVFSKSAASAICFRNAETFCRVFFNAARAPCVTRSFSRRNTSVSLASP